MDDRKWTVDDVHRLVEAVKEIKSSGHIHHYTLDIALAPFQPDPDEELVKAIQDIRFEPDQDFSPIRIDATRRIIAAVRDHDAKAKG